MQELTCGCKSVDVMALRRRSDKFGDCWPNRLRFRLNLKLKEKNHPSGEWRECRELESCMLYSVYAIQRKFRWKCTDLDWFWFILLINFFQHSTIWFFKFLYFYEKFEIAHNFFTRSLSFTMIYIVVNIFLPYPHFVYSTDRVSV